VEKDVVINSGQGIGRRRFGCEKKEGGKSRMTSGFSDLAR
jgi:hypothetical protein